MPFLPCGDLQGVGARCLPCVIRVTVWEEYLW